MYQVNENGFYGEFGGAYIPEILYNNVKNLMEQYLQIMGDPSFQAEVDHTEDQPLMRLPA